MAFSCPNCETPLSTSGTKPRFCSQCGTGLTEYWADDATRRDDETVGHLESSRSKQQDPAETAWHEDAEYFEPSGGMIGPYNLIRKLGQGGMGTVYEALHEETGQSVALKLLSRKLRGTDETEQRFRRESHIAASINHPRSTFVYEAGHHNGQYFIAMELMSGGTLKEVIEENGPLPVDQAVDYVLDLISGLAAAHVAGIVHRDLKPSNCFIDQEGRVKVGDFGLSKSFVADASLTRTGQFMGTPQYAAPEQLRGGAVDARTDIYAIGGTLFYLLTGRPPFRGDAAKVIASIASDAPPATNLINKDVPRELSRLIGQILEKNPDRRPQNLASLRASLAPFSARGANLADVGRRMTAFFIDFTIATFGCSAIAVPFAIGAAFLAKMAGFITIAGVGLGEAFTSLFQIVLMVCYFAISEWCWGRTIGKWIFSMRVIDSNSESPGLIASIARAFLVPGLTWTLSVAPMFFIGPDIGNQIGIQDIVRLAAIFVITSIGAWIPTLFCLSTARAKNGFRGVHELLTGTHVVRLGGDFDTQRLKQIPTTAAVKITPMPIGSYQAIGELAGNDETKVYLGNDDELQRDVWIFHGGEISTIDPKRKSVSRPSRLRVLSESVVENWHVTDALHGVPMVDIFYHRKRCEWTSIRPLFLELAKELDIAANEGTLPKQLKPDQVWVDKMGRLKLLDQPLPGELVNQSRPIFPIFEDPDPHKRAADLISNLLEIYNSRHPVPYHVTEFTRVIGERSTDPEKREKNLRQARTTLAEFAEKPSRWNWDDRLGVLAVSFGLELPAYTSFALLSGVVLMQFIRQSPWVLGTLVVALGCLLCFVLGYFMNGGPAVRFCDACLLRAGMKKLATPFRCGLRNVFAWLPFIVAVSFVNVVLQQLFVDNDLIASGVQETNQTMVVSLLLILPVSILILIGIGIALAKPTRGVPDLISGTKLVRR